MTTSSNCLLQRTQMACVGLGKVSAGHTVGPGSCIGLIIHYKVFKSEDVCWDGISRAGRTLHRKVTV